MSFKKQFFPGMCDYTAIIQMCDPRTINIDSHISDAREDASKTVVHNAAHYDNQEAMCRDATND